MEESSVNSSEPQNESQSQEEERNQDVCLKCSMRITHIPYKYNGQTFHARCLLCNLCGKKLVGKPFITDGTKIFCGDQCKTTFKENPPSMITMFDTSMDSMESEGSQINGTMDESLLEALESIKDSKQSVMRLTRQNSPLQVLDPDRITDYPRRPSPDSSLARTPLSGSRCSSLSTVSQSSLTSDSSYSFDASKRPRKNILKNPHRPHRRSRNRVRWNLPNRDSRELNDSDTMSLESFDSTSTSSSVYFRANQRLAESKTNWREFERHPTPGSTGMTPAKPPNPQNSYQNATPSPSVVSISPLNVSSYQTTMLKAPHITVDGIRTSQPSEATRFKRSPSPLALITSPSKSSSGSLQTSTPMRRANSDSAATVKLKTYENSLCEGEDDDIDIPILQFDHSNLSMLEESTLEDKKKAHIFPFPQNASTPARSFSRSQPAVRTAFLEEDDASDYDHLSPRVIPTSYEKTKKNDAKDSKVREESESYSDKDIDDAFDAMGSSGSSSGSTVPSPKIENPPPIPRKKNIEAHYHLQTASPDSAQSDTSGGSLSPTSPTLTSPSSLTSQSSNESRIKQLIANFSGNNNNSSVQHISTTQDKSGPKSPQKPPPVPPKTRRSKRVDSDRETTPNQRVVVGHAEHSSQSGRQSSPLFPSQSDNAGGNQPGCSPDDEILPPPPEFAQSSQGDDELGSDLHSVSNSTLVEESLEGSPDGTKYATTSQRTKVENPPPAPSYSAHNLHPRSSSYPLKIKDRIVVGAEDPRQVRDDPVPQKKQQQFSSRPIQAFQNDKLFRDLQYKSQVTANPQVQRNEQVHSTAHWSAAPPQSSQFLHPQTKTRASSLSVPPTSPRHKIKMEKAFNEGNVPSNAKSMPLNHQTHQTRTVTDYPPNRGLTADTNKLHPLVASRGRSTSLTNARQSSSSEQRQQAWKTFNSRPMEGKPPLAKSASSQDRELSNLFRDLDIKDKPEGQRTTGSYGICSVCGKSIQNLKELFKYSDYFYHNRCFRCVGCRSGLRGKKVLKVRNNLLCKDCYPQYDIKVGQAHRAAESQEPNYSRSNSFHVIPVSGGQITSV